MGVAVVGLLEQVAGFELVVHRLRWLQPKALELRVLEHRQQGPRFLFQIMPGFLHR
jgi:hypothetical protein